MGERLPVISGAEAVRVFGIFGYEFGHQTGSHVIIRRNTPPHRHLSIPQHRELKRGLLRGLIREAGLTVEEFVARLKS